MLLSLEGLHTGNVTTEREERTLGQESSEVGQVPAPQCAGCVTWGKLPNTTEPQLSLYNDVHSDNTEGSCKNKMAEKHESVGQFSTLQILGKES